MNIMCIKLFVTIFLITNVLSDNDCDNVKCPRVSKHYKELSCTPIKENNGCCVSRFECPDKASYDLDKCYWNGKIYGLNELVPDNETIGMCNILCSCVEGRPFGQPAKFRCKNKNCPHFSKTDLLGCIKQSSLDGCCPDYLCDEEEKNSLGTGNCFVDGKKYNIGDSIFPETEQCYGCICSHNFDNSTFIDNPSCKEYKCGIGLRYFNNIRDGCIPIYYDAESCCPIEWRCPQDSDDIVPTKSRSSEPVNPKFQCQFGKLALNIGDEIKSENDCDVCKCTTPPMAHCVKRSDC